MHDQRADHVAVDERWLGFDRRSVPPALVVVAVFLLSVVVIPLVDRLVPWDDPVRAGDVLALSDSVVFSPEPGWNIEAGFRTDGSPITDSGVATLTSSGVVIQLTADVFHGTPAELLAQIDRVTAATEDPSFRGRGEPSTVTTAAGAAGVQQRTSGLQGDGVLAAFVLGDTGVQVSAQGTPAQLRVEAAAIERMIASIREVSTGAAR